MVKIPVYLRDMYDAKHLVQIAESCRGDVDLLCGRYVVDAKSMLGVFSASAGASAITSTLSATEAASVA